MSAHHEQLAGAGGPLPALELVQVLTVVSACAADPEAAATAVAARFRVQAPPEQELPQLGLAGGQAGTFVALQPAAALRLVAEVALARELLRERLEEHDQEAWLEAQGLRHPPAPSAHVECRCDWCREARPLVAASPRRA